MNSAPWQLLAVIVAVCRMTVNDSRVYVDDLHRSDFRVSTPEVAAGPDREPRTLNQRVIGSSPIQGIPKLALTIPSRPISFLTGLEPVSNWVGCAKSAPKTVGAPWSASSILVVNELT